MTDKQEDKGQEVDSSLANGPVENRGCTDILCCLLFIAAVGAFIGIAIDGYRKGQPSILAVPYDSDGKACGVSDGYQDYKYIYFPQPFIGTLERTTCLKKCPTFNKTSVKPTTLECHTNKIITSCDVKNTIEADNPASIALAKTSTFNLYNTTGIFGKICFPSLEIVKSVNVSSAINIEKLGQWMSDVKTSWGIILASAGFAIVIGFIYMILLRFCAGIMTWLSILIYLASLVVLGGVFWKKYQDQKNEQTAATGTTDSSEDTNANPWTNSTNALMGIAIIFWILAGISIIIFCCLFNRIRLAIAIMKTAASYVKDNLFSILVPPVFTLLVIGFWAFWIGAMLYLYSVGNLRNDDENAKAHPPFASIEWEQKTRYLIIYQIFAGLWINAFIQALSQFILASSCCIWYFGQGGGQGAHAPLSRSIYRAFRYHIGSLAFGALLLAIIQMIRLILAYIHGKMKESGATQNKCLDFFMRCLQCYMACFERFIRFLNKNAYIQIALQAKHFCASAKEAFFLILRNPARFTVVASIGEVFIFIGKLFISGLSTFFAYLIIANASPYKEELHSVWLPTLFFVIVTYTIGILFMSVYGMAADTILQCFLVDEEISKKTGGAAQHCPETLKEFLDAHVRK